MQSCRCEGGKVIRRVLGRRLPSYWFSVAVVVLFATGASAQRKQLTLANVLSKAGLKPSRGAVSDLERPITSYAVLDNHDVYVIAYYWELSSGMLEDPLRVLRLDRRSGEWERAQLMLGGDQIGHGECVGPVLQVHAAPDTLLIDTLINPSAACLLILQPNLKFRNALFGWYLAALDERQVIFQRGEVHYAAVHPTELALYDVKTNRETPLFPRKPSQQIRAKLAAELSEFYRTHEEWCSKNNDPCDGESVDSSLVGEVAVNAREHALAFVISYDRIQHVDGVVQRPAGPDRVVYVYRNVGDEESDYREMLLSDVEARFGKTPLKSLLEPEALQKIFGK